MTDQLVLHLKREYFDAIKRKINRWQNRIEKMPILEKRALLLAMERAH